jgi:excinuclease ABC subunit A
MEEKMDSKKYIVVKGARENNLKNLDVTIPKGYFDGLHRSLSGSGKSTLAFDTIYAEGSKTLRRIPEPLCPPIPRRG